MNDATLSRPATQPSRPAEDPASEDIDLREIVALLLAGKWWIAGITALVLTLGVLYAFLATPVYRVDAMLHIQQQSSSLTSASQNKVLSSLFGASSLAQAEIQIMTSRAVLGPVIRKLNLNAEVKGAPPSAVTVKKLAIPADWQDERLRLRADNGDGYTLFGPDGNKRLTGRVGQTSSSNGDRVKIKLSHLALAASKSLTLVHEPVQKTFKSLSKRLTAGELGKHTGTGTGIVRLELTGAYPARISHILNALVNQYLKRNVTAHSAQARRSLEFVKNQLPALKKKMNVAETRLTRYQVKHATVNIDEQAKAFLKQAATLQSELSQLKLAEASLSQQYTEKYPAFAALKKQQASVKSKIATLRGRLNHLPQDEQGYVRLKRNVKVYTTLYTTLLSKEQDLSVAAASSVGSARVVTRAATPIEPVKPNKRLVVLLALVLGLIAGVGVVLVRRALSHGLTDPLEIEDRFGIPLYAVVAHSDTEKRLQKRRQGGAGAGETLLAYNAPQEPAVEALRSLRTSLEFTLRDAKNPIVALSGPAPGVGKSFVAANLAYLAATGGRRTLLVDCDLRKGHLHKYLGQAHSPGVAELLTQEVQFAECVKTNLLDTSLDFVPTGAYPSNPAELFLKKDIGGLLSKIGGGYDLVLIDLPPVLSVTDSVIVMRSAGVNLMMLRAGRHASQEVGYALARLTQNGIAVAGFLLNDMTRRAAAYSYGGYGYYGDRPYGSASQKT